MNPHTTRMFSRLALISMTLLLLFCCLSGCLSQPKQSQDALIQFQESIAQAPSKRIYDPNDTYHRPVDLLRQPKSTLKDDLDFTAIDTNAPMDLSLNDAVMSALANNQEIRSASLDSEINKQAITKSLSEFDPTVYSDVNYKVQDEPTTTTTEIGQSDTRSLETGIKRKNTSGTEWSARYVLTRTWDDYVARPANLRTRWTPVLAFQLKKPLWRDGDRQAVLAGVNIARLNNRIALLEFRKTSEQVATEAIYAYWQLYQARQNLDIQRQLYNMAVTTLQKVKGRDGIDATDIQIQESLSSTKTRQALVLDAEKKVQDVQDQLIRTLAMPQADLLGDIDIVPTTPPHENLAPLDDQGILSIAIERHPAILEAKLKVNIADLNIKIAKNKKMPRLDFVLSTSTSSLARQQNKAQQHLFDGDFVDKAVGLNFEYPLGNRASYADYQKRRLERLKAISDLHNTADKLTVQVKEAIRAVEIKYQQIDIQRQAVEAAKAHMKALEDSESIRDKLTPEFLFVKLQAQDTYANARRAHVQAITEFNLALARLSQVTGSVLKLHRIQSQ